MKPYLLVLWLSLCPSFALLAQSGAPPAPEAAIYAPRLSAPQQAAFERRTEQKWEDFLAYLTLMGRGDQDAALRAYAREAALGLFEAEGTALTTWTGQPLRAWLDSLLTAGAGIAYQSQPGSFVFEGFQASDDARLYTGSFRVVLAERPGLPPLKLRVRVSLRRQEKAFGPQADRVWEVKLGQIARG